MTVELARILSLWALSHGHLVRNSKTLPQLGRHSLVALFADRLLVVLVEL
jgi:hypothetical protein